LAPVGYESSYSCFFSGSFKDFGYCWGLSLVCLLFVVVFSASSVIIVFFWSFDLSYFWSSCFGGGGFEEGGGFEYFVSDGLSSYDFGFWCSFTFASSSFYSCLFQELFVYSGWFGDSFVFFFSGWSVFLEVSSVVSLFECYCFCLLV
jgi:hypothetical protein